MKAILFGATGMVGQGVLRECLIDGDVAEVLSVGRSPTGVQHAKLREIMHDDFTDFTKIESELAGFGVRSKTPWINAVYALTAPLLSYGATHAEPDDNQRTTRPRHDQGGAGRLSEANTGER